MQLPLLALVFISAAVSDSTTTGVALSLLSSTDSLIFLHGKTPAATTAGSNVSISTTSILPGTDISTPWQTWNTSVSAEVTKLVGSSPPLSSAGNATSATPAATAMATATTASVLPTNTQPCNGHPEFCRRRYSNITMVAAHNSPFVRSGNAASNQALGVLSQLDDGIRMLQFQVHMVNDTLYLCHTSCDLLNVGTLESYLATVATWMKQHPYDVITILMGNYDRVDPSLFVPPFINSGLEAIAYTPSMVPMTRNDWPDLSTMILSNTRVVVFLDYLANQTKVPWLMDEFSQMWETPFSPTNSDFPCTIQRPPGLSPKDAKNRLYLANHNLNVQVSFGSFSILIPNMAQLVQSNSVRGQGSLGRMARSCTETWDRPPNFLLVDYYNYGKPNGSVFEVAAIMNNVSYNFHCCGKSSTASVIKTNLDLLEVFGVAAGIHFLMHIFS